MHIHHATVAITSHAPLTMRNEAFVDLPRICDGSALGVDERQFDGVHGAPLLLKSFRPLMLVLSAVFCCLAEGVLTRGITVDGGGRSVFPVGGRIAAFCNRARAVGTSRGRSRATRRTFAACRDGGIFR